ncbi:MAG: DNA internalization-related competence protein ComEC/Rec2 [Melioribacteraceae bacterium]|nr:DNA internalization-related competence protein ComEC/Rec2 [Melioribacteraceae bacterium]
MNRYPLIKFALFFIIGIIFSKYFSFSIPVLFILSAVTISLSILLAWLKKFNLSVILVYFIIFVAGLTYSEVRNLRSVSYPFEDPKINNSLLFGEITDIDLMQNDRISFKVRTDSLFANKEYYSSELILLTRVFDKNLSRTFEKLKIGNKVILKGTLQKGRETRNPGEFNYQKYLESEGINGLFNIYRKSDLKIVDDQSNFFPQFIFELRKGIDEKLSRFHNKETYGLLRGLLLADRKLIDYETREEFINSGVVHVLAVSGLHVGYIMLIFLILFNRTNIILRISLTIIGLLFFLLLTNSPASVFRASVMSITGLSVFLLNREYNGINALSIAAFIILLINPNDLFTPGFQLSFSAVAAILILMPRFSKRIEKLKLKKYYKQILLFASVSIAAQIGTLPFTLFYFGKLSVIAIFANIIVIPLIGLILPLGIVSLILGSFIPWFGFIYGAANNMLVTLLFNFVGLFSNIPLAFLDVINFSIYDGILFYIVIGFILSKTFYGFRLSIKFIVILLLIINYFLYSKFDDKSIIKENLLTLIYIDVDQGDAFLINFPNGKTALIDAGNATKYFDTGKHIIHPLLKQLKIDKIDYAFISHLDADHYLGIHYLIENGIIDTVYKPVTDLSVRKEKEFLNFLTEQRTVYRYYHQNILSIGNTSLYFLSDTTDYVSKRFDSNNKSGVIKLIHGDNSFLFTGDAEIPSERYLVNKFGKFLDSDVLKLGHHGSKTSSSERFLDFVAPEVGIISAGIENRFNHPSDIILQRLEQMDINYKRTDKSGAIIIQSDGENYKFIDWRNFDTFTLSN